MNPEAKTELPVFYYLDNFQYLIDFVVSKSSHLLIDREKQFIGDFKKLKRFEKALYVRIFNRKGHYFNISKFNYPEIKKTHSVINNLTAKNFVSTLHEDDACYLKDVIRILTKDELIDVGNSICDNKIKKTFNRNEVIERLQEFNSEDVINIIKSKHTIIKQLRSDEAEMIKFLFFGSTDYDMTEFVIRDIGNAVFHEYDERKLKPFFSNRKDAEDKMKITKLYAEFKVLRQDRSPVEIYAWFKDQRLENISDYAQPVFTKLVNKIGYDLERAELLNEAQEIYCITDKHPARERRVRIFDVQKQTNKAVDLCNHILKTSTESKEIIFAKDYLNKIKKIKKQTTQKLNDADKIIISKSAANRVEEEAMDYFAENGYSCFYSENFLWRSLFGLVLWEIIFDEEFGAIHNPLQRMPSDLYQPEFFNRRHSKCVELFNKLKNKRRLLKHIRKNRKRNYGKINPLFGWDLMQVSMVETIIKFIEPPVLFEVLKEMSKNIKSNCSGFPDLLVYNETEYFFAEIKSPNDHLSDQQLFWLEFFEKNKINAKVIKINWAKKENPVLTGLSIY